MSLMKVHYITADVVNKFKDMYQKIKTPNGVDSQTEFNHIKTYLQKFTNSDDNNIKEKATKLNNSFRAYVKMRENLQAISLLSSEAYDNPDNVNKLNETMALMDAFVGNENNPGFAEALRDFNVATGYDASNEKAFYDLTTLTCNTESLAMDLEEIAINESNLEGPERRNTADAIHNSIEEYQADIDNLRLFVMANETAAPSQAQEKLEEARKVCSDALVGIRKVEKDINTYTEQKESSEVGYKNAQTEIDDLNKQIGKSNQNIESYNNEIKNLQDEIEKLKIEHQQQMNKSKEAIAKYTLEIDGESEDELYERQAILLDESAALEGFINQTKDNNTRLTQNYVKQTEKVMEPYNLLGTGSMTNAQRIKSFLEDQTGEYLDDFIKKGYAARTKYNKDLAQYNKNPNKDLTKAPELKEDPMFTVYAAFADEYEKEHKGQAKEKFKEMCENAVAAEFVWNESHKKEERFQELLKQYSFTDNIVVSYKSFLDRQGRSKEYEGLSNKELLTMDKVGKYALYHEADWADADEAERAEMLKNDPGIDYTPKSTLYLDAEGNLLYGKEIKNAKEKWEVEATVASKFEDLIDEKIQKDNAAKAKANENKGFFRRLISSSPIQIVEKISLTNEQLSTIHQSANKVAPKYEYERDLYPVDYENYQEYKKQKVEFDKEFPGKTFNGDVVLMNAFKKSMKGEFDKVVSRIPMPELIDYTAEAERLQKYRIEKEQVTNQIKQAIVKKNERKLSKEKLQSIYDIDLKEQKKFEDKLKELQDKIDKKNGDIKYETALIDNLTREHNAAVVRHDDYLEKFNEATDNIQLANKQKDELKEIYSKNNERVGIYTELSDKVKNIDGKLPKIDNALKNYNKKFNHVQEPDMRRDRCLKKVMEFINRQNDCAQGHSNSDEYKTMIDRLTDLKNVLENPQSSNAAIIKAMKDANKGAEDYVTEKMKYGRTWGRKIRHVRLNFAKEVGLWAKDMAKNMQKSINANALQTKAEKDLFSYNIQKLTKTNAIEGFKSEMSKSGIDYDVLKQRKDGIDRFENERRNDVGDNGLESKIFEGLQL